MLIFLGCSTLRANRLCFQGIPVGKVSENILSTWNWCNLVVETISWPTRTVKSLNQANSTFNALWNEILENVKRKFWSGFFSNIVYLVIWCPLDLPKRLPVGFEAKRGSEKSGKCTRKRTGTPDNEFVFRRVQFNNCSSMSKLWPRSQVWHRVRRFCWKPMIFGQYAR